MMRRRRMPGEDEPVTVRRAAPDDSAALLRLAALDGAPPLCGEVVVAEIGGELWAARSIIDGRAVSDPFRPSAACRALLELHCRHLQFGVAGSPGGRGRGRFGLRALLRAGAAT